MKLVAGAVELDCMAGRSAMAQKGGSKLVGLRCWDKRYVGGRCTIGTYCYLGSQILGDMKCGSAS